MEKQNMSFKGWSLKEWFLGNWGTVKEVIKVGLPLVVGLMSTSNPVTVGAITVVGKCILDVGQYFFKAYSE
jgi:hypothetical protein